jgi:hypothetical protein
VPLLQEFVDRDLGQLVDPGADALAHALDRGLRVAVRPAERLLDHLVDQAELASGRSPVSFSASAASGALLAGSSTGSPRSPRDEITE